MYLNPAIISYTILRPLCQGINNTCILFSELQLKACGNDESIRAVFSNSATNLDTLYSTGFSKPVNTIKVSDKALICSTLKCHFMLKGVLAEMNEFSEGLKSLGVLDLIKQYPDLMRVFFVDEERPLTACTVLVHCSTVYTICGCIYIL